MNAMPNRTRDERFMRMALSLAHRGTGFVSPNPLVGCVIVNEREDRIVSTGYHRAYGGPHAEADALLKAGEAARGCTAYVTLEPCCHTGKTPPCSDALIRASVSRVVVGTGDPNPLVGGGGIAALRAAGIDVETGVLDEACRRINRGFIRRVTLGRPWVLVKSAMSLDGDMALRNGVSKWITSAASRKRAHMLRAENDALLVGVGTVLHDDPALTVREAEGRDSLKVVIDPRLETPRNAALLGGDAPMFFISSNADMAKKNDFERLGARFAVYSGEGRIPVAFILEELARRGVNRLMIEGGPTIVGSFIRANAVDEYALFIAPKLLGAGITMTKELFFESMQETISMESVRITKIENDILLEGIPYCSPAL